MAQVAGHGQGRPGPQRPEGHVTHDMDAEARDPGHAGVFDPGVLVGSLPARIRGENDTVAPHSGRLAGLHQDFRDADPGHVPGRHQARQQPQPAVRATAAGRVEDTLRLELGPRLGGHDHAQPGQPVAHIRRDSG